MVVAVTSNDWHLNESNLEEISGLIFQKIKLAKKNNTKVLIAIGDIFDSRKSQSEAVLTTFSKILDRILEEEMTIIVIPGNHDKTDYSSQSSFLVPFQHHPAIKLYSESQEFSLGKLKCYSIPFFENNVWLEEFKKIKTPVDVLFTHIAVNGSVNNDNSKVESPINPSLFRKFKQVFLGHYHNEQYPGLNIVHLPSIRQKDFGEDKTKGFTLINEDGTFTIVQSQFKLFEVVELAAEKVDSSVLKSLLEEFQTKDCYLKVKLVGKDNELKSLDINSLKSAGIKVDTKSLTIQQSIDSVDEPQVDLTNKDTILDLFSSFCAERELNFEEGIIILRKIMGNGTN